MLDQQKYQESVERFDKSLDLDKSRSVVYALRVPSAQSESPKEGADAPAFRKPRNVLPLVNKALAIFQWKQDMPQAEALCNEALTIDPDCDVAVATLAQLSLQQGRIDDAIKWFEKSGELARTEGELSNAITCGSLPSVSFSLLC